MADTNPNAILLDDFDPSITYIGTGWYPGGTPPLEYNGTTHGTSFGGSRFSVTFTGTSISVYGTLAANVSGVLRSSYTFDDGPKAFFDAPPNQTSIVYHTLFYASPIVQNGTHTLVGVVEDISPGNNYYLDYLSYTPGSNAADPSTSSTTSLPAATSLFESAAPNVTTTGPSIGVLIPAIIVPICGTLLLLLFCVWWLLRRRGTDWERSISNVDTRSERPVSLLFGHIKPYPAPYAGSRSSDGVSSHTGSLRRNGTSGTRESDYEASVHSVHSAAYREPATSDAPYALPRTPGRTYQGGAGRSVRGRTGNTTSVNNSDIPPAYASAY